MIDIVLGLAFLGASLSTVDVNSKIYIDTDEPKYYSVSAPVDVNLGVGVLQGKTQITKQLLKNNIYSSYSQKILYKYPNAISAPIEIYDDCYLNIIHLEAENTNLIIHMHISILMKEYVL